MLLYDLLKELKVKANPEKARILSGFFKTGKGEYGKGDFFLGIAVPESRKLAVKYGELALSDVSKLIKNKYHEARLVALLILVHKYKTRQPHRQDLWGKQICDFYLSHTKYINNWDLVDLSAGYIVGDYLYKRTVIKRVSPRTVLEKLANSKNLWEKRIAIISTFAFIYKGEPARHASQGDAGGYKWTFKIVKILMKDKHDLIKKACGWMLREVGKRVSEKELIKFLDSNIKNMSRTMLRYAIERLPEAKRKYYLHKK
ncbi:MAG TPA: DNA alkylation repair protein [Candidatus Paceibacterota bacterium]|jgi:3-methyladenine DNA glycosylase AlkD|nr:DNA alkylation repair protein [Candidatus Paceibacterota bacterium]